MRAHTAARAATRVQRHTSRVEQTNLCDEPSELQHVQSQAFTVTEVGPESKRMVKSKRKDKSERKGILVL